MKKEIRRIIITLVALCSVFVSLIVYLSYFQVFKAEGIKNNPYNKRLWINEENVERGSILDRNDRVLVYSEKKEDSNKRYYKYGRLYSHVIGYSYREYGKDGLELQYNNELLDISESTALNEIKNLVLPSSIGNNLKLTIDHGLQEKSNQLLQGKKGALVVMNPSSGEIYSKMSKPDFDVSNLTEEWASIAEDDGDPLYNRATQGLYSPGSTYKIITTASILDTSSVDQNYDCSGSTKIDGKKFKDYNGIAHGNLDLKGAFANSCNTYFLEKGLDVGKEKLGSISEDFMINKKINFDLATKTSKFSYKGSLSDADMASSAIGQGKVLVTPLNMAMIASTIANDGQMVKPILVKEILNRNQKTIREFNTEVISEGIGSHISSQIKEMMLEAVNSGTGTRAKIANIQVAGKTGTAENSSGKDHSWFVGFAPYDEPKVAIVVILEEEGRTGGEAAAPIARDMIIHALNNIDF